MEASQAGLPAAWTGAYSLLQCQAARTAATQILQVPSPRICRGELTRSRRTAAVAAACSWLVCTAVRNDLSCTSCCTSGSEGSTACSMGAAVQWRMGSLPLGARSVHLGTCE